ncbi:MAG: hypothetical protein PHH69_03200 [Candidatus Omnitrophica bacterium]|nr:hypothetical protein [Candidatus Omnitrophota bacterium]
MYDYAIIVHPTNEELLHRYEPGMKHRPRPLVKKVLEWMSPFKASEVSGLISPRGPSPKGTLVMCPLLMEQMISLSPHRVMASVSATIKFALELGTKLIGLTAYTAFSGNKGQDLARHLNIALTTGTSYTLGMLPEAILRAADLMDVELDKTNILIVGATTSIGKFCIEIFAQLSRGIFITANNQVKLNLLLAGLSKEKKAKLENITNIESVFDRVKIIIIATNRLPEGLDFNKIKPGTIIFDTSYPRRIPSNMRDDILVIDGVAIKPPGKNVDFDFDFGLPKGLCYPCMAEPIILAMEQKFENYSLGRDPDPVKIKEIMRLGTKYGFEVANLTSQEKLISDENILRIKNRAQEKVSKATVR